jgi:hypothetical protein
MTTTLGYGDLGTDGKDLVWIEASGRTTDTGPFDTYTIMTAPYTTEPGSVVSRRLRTEQGPDFDVVYFQVGCGYAARSNGEHIRVVRLSDGQSWVLTNALTDPWGWTEPLAVTCTELFATVRNSGVTRLARVRLDSLGPGPCGGERLPHGGGSRFVAAPKWQGNVVVSERLVTGQNPSSDTAADETVSARSLFRLATSWGPRRLACPPPARAPRRRRAPWACDSARRT